MKKCFIIVSIIFLFFVCFTPNQSFAAVTKFGKLGLDQTAGQITDSGLKKTNIPTMIGKALGVLLYTVAVIFFILMVYAGILWMTARGKEDQAKKAQSTIIAASVGLIIVLSSYSLTNFLFASLEGESIQNCSSKGVHGGNMETPCYNKPIDSVCTIIIPNQGNIQGTCQIKNYTNIPNHCHCETAFQTSEQSNLFVPELCPNTQVSTEKPRQNLCIGRRIGEICDQKVGSVCELEDSVCGCAAAEPNP